MTFILMVAAACCAFASACGEAVRVYGEAGGVVRMPGVSARFYPHVFNLEWGGGPALSGRPPGITPAVSGPRRLYFGGALEI